MSQRQGMLSLEGGRDISAPTRVPSDAGSGCFFPQSTRLSHVPGGLTDRAHPVRVNRRLHGAWEPVSFCGVVIAPWAQIRQRVLLGPGRAALFPQPQPPEAASPGRWARRSAVSGIDALSGRTQLGTAATQDGVAAAAVVPESPLASLQAPRSTGTHCFFKVL